MKKYIVLIAGLLPMFASAQLVMTGSYYVVLNGGSQSNPTSLVLTNPAPAGITNNGSGWIVSENEFNQVDWNIGTNTGNYVVPFGYGSSEYLPVTCDVTAAGVGSGSIKFATYHGANWDNSLYEPADVSNMTDFGAVNYSNNAVDRFWILDAQAYTTKPTPDITFTYIRNGAESEIADPNYIVEADLIAQRFNSSSNEWYDWDGATGNDVTSGNTGTVKSGTVPVSGFYRSWCLFNDSNLITSVAEVNNATSVIKVYPSPTNGSFTVAGLVKGQIIELYNYLGQNLSSAVASNSTVQFNIATFANGMYLVRILNTDGSLVTQNKIVKTE
jgi:hypothetical protein